MTTGKEAFESACQIGVSKSYNHRQLSQIFFGIDAAIQEIEISGGGNIVVSGTAPDGAEEGQIGFFQGSDGNYYEYIWVDDSWRNVKTQNNDVTVGGSAPFVTISGTTLNTQQDINLYLNDKIENLIVDPSGAPIDLEPFATKEYVESGLAEKVSCSGDTMTGRLTIKKDREDKNSIAFSIAGRIRNNANEIVEDILLKSYQRQNSSDTQSDYIVYYGSTGGANEILNRVTAQQEFAAKGTFDASVSGLEQRVTDGEVLQASIQTTVADALVTQSGLINQVSGINLETVLTNGNIADQTILLSDGTDALVSLLPNEASVVIASDTDKKNPRIRFTHIDEAGYPNSHFQLELDGDGTRADFEFEQAITSAHFNFDGNDKFILNKDGDAEFIGKLKAAPAVLSTELSTLGQLETVESDIQAEQTVQNQQINALETQIQLLAQTQAAGKWTYERNINGSVRPPSTATFYGTHSGDVTTVLTDWSDLRLIMVDKTDIDGTTYNFSNFEEGDKIEILATDGSSAVFGTVSNDPNNDTYGNMIVAVERSSGGPTEGKEYVLSVYRPGANGGDVDLDVLDGRYVIKTGDTITGNLKLDNKLDVDGKSTFNEKVSIVPNADSSSSSFIVYGRVDGFDTSPLLLATNDGFFHNNDDCIEYYGTSVTDDSLVNAKWVSDAINAAVDGGALSDDYLSTNGGVLTGNLVLNGGGLYTDSIIKNTRNSGYAFQVKPDDGDATAFIHTNGNAEFAKVKVEAAPANDTDLTNKSYVDTKVAEITVSGIDATGLMTLNTEQTITESGTKTIESLFNFSRNQGETPVRFLINNNKACEIYYDSADTTRFDITEGKEFKIVTTPVSGVAQQVLKTYTDGEIRVEHLKEPDQPHHAATKAYVDTRTSPSFRWERVANNTSAENLTAGQFFIADNGNIYFHPVSADGVDFNVNSVTTGISSSFKQMVTVHAEDGSPKYFITATSILFNNSDNNYMRLTMSFVHIDDVTVVGESYRLNIPGFTF